jgi:hypothetical protein
MNALPDIAAARERVVQRIAKIEKELTQLRTELADLDAAERVLKKLGAVSDSETTPRLETKAPAGDRIRDHIYNALASFGEAWSRPEDIKKRVQETVSIVVKDTTLAGTLYRFRREGLANQQGKLWRATALPSPLPQRAADETEDGGQNIDLSLS